MNEPGRSLLKTFYRSRGKRILDLAVAGILLLLLSPLLVLLGLAVRWSLGKPVLFRQTRPGLDSRPFVCIKFRTMRQLGDEPGGQSDAERLTPFGTFLRRTSLDELPELWNVLRGEMSLVGPRPLRTRYLERYSPEQARRHLVRPGMTGWGQIKGRNAVDWEEKLRHDVWYVDHLSLGLDLRILLATIWTVLRGDDIAAPGHATMPEFMGSDHQQPKGGPGAP